MIARAVLSLLLITICASLSGCDPVSCTVSGAQALYNRHSIQKNINDNYTTLQVNEAINSNKKLEKTNIAVTTFNRIVLLTGQVQTTEQRALLDKVMKTIPNVKQFYNLTAISSPASDLTQVSDAWITAKVKLKFIATNEIDPSQIKVVTDNGTVYLMGIILPSQAKPAIYLARTTEGVQNVVKIFSYLKISKQM